MVVSFQSTPKWDYKGQRNLRKVIAEVRSFIDQQSKREEQERARQEWIQRVRQRLQQREQRVREQQEQQP